MSNPKYKIGDVARFKKNLGGTRGFQPYRDPFENRDPFEIRDIKSNFYIVRFIGYHYNHTLTFTDSIETELEAVFLLKKEYDDE